VGGMTISVPPWGMLLTMEAAGGRRRGQSGSHEHA
jgi:hypothetical protein